MQALAVEFIVRPGKEQAFRERVLRQAADSRAHEEGCVVFDVCEDPANPARFFLYEVYTDADAVAAHRRTSYFESFSADIADLIESRSRSELVRIS